MAQWILTEIIAVKSTRKPWQHSFKPRKKCIFPPRCHIMPETSMMYFRREQSEHTSYTITPSPFFLLSVSLAPRTAPPFPRAALVVFFPPTHFMNEGMRALAPLHMQRKRRIPRATARWLWPDNCWEAVTQAARIFICLISRSTARTKREACHFFNRVYLLVCYSTLQLGQIYIHQMYSSHSLFIY